MELELHANEIAFGWKTSDDDFHTYIFINMCPYFLNFEVDKLDFLNIELYYFEDILTVA